MAIRLHPLARGGLADAIISPAFKAGHGWRLERTGDAHLNRLLMSRGVNKATGILIGNERDGETLGEG